MCALALVASVKKPVDSTTTSTPMSPHFRAAGSRSANAVISWSPTRIEVSVDAHVGVEAAEDRVELEQVGEALVVGEVVDADDLDVGPRRAHGAEEVAADAAEAVDTNADSHSEFSWVSDLRSRQPTLSRCWNVPEARPAYVPVTARGRAVRLPRPASPGSARTPCRVCRAPRPACRPSPAAGGCGRRSRPWSAPAR